MNEEMLTFSLAFSPFGKALWEKRDEDTKLRMPLFFRLCFTALVLHLQRQKSRYKIAGIDYEKHGDGVCFYFGSEDWEIDSGRRREKDRLGGWTTVRLQHSRDEFPFVIPLAFLSNPFYYYSLVVFDDDKKMVGMEVSFCFNNVLFLSFFLTRRDDILVLKDIHYITGWGFVFLSALEYLSFSNSLSCVFVTNTTL